MPDGQTRRTSASPGIPGVVRRGGPPGLAGQVADRVLGPRQATGIEVVRAADWLGIMPDSTLRADVCLAVARTKPGRLPAAITIDQSGVAGDEDMQLLRQLVQSVALGVA